MLTKEQIFQRVGEDLSIVPIGQSLENHDKNRISSAYDEVYARLKAKSLATWASTAQVPSELVPYVCLMLEEKLLTTYSVPESRYQRIRNDAGPDGNFAVSRIAMLVNSSIENIEQNEDY